LEPLGDCANSEFVKIAGRFFSIACDERGGSAFIKQRDGGDQTFEWDVQLLGNMNQDVRGGSYFDCDMQRKYPSKRQAGRKQRCRTTQCGRLELEIAKKHPKLFENFLGSCNIYFINRE
jgi:hypothetical protein